MMRPDSQHHHHHSKGHGGGTAHDAAHSGYIGGGGSGDHGQSKADFLSTFTEDPHLLNFARHFCDAGGDGDEGRGGGGSVVGLPSGRRLMLGTEALGHSPALARYFGGALLECLAGEKTEALAPHLSLCHSVVTARHTADAAAAWDLRLVLDYGRGSALQTALASEASASTASVVLVPPGGEGRVEGSAGGAGRGADSVGATAGVGREAGSRNGGGAAGEDAQRKREETEPPLPFALLHSDLLASLEVQLDAFFSSIDFDDARGGLTDEEVTGKREKAQSGGTRSGGRRPNNHQLWQYLSGGAVDFGDDIHREKPRLFGAFLAYFGVPSPPVLEQALGGKVVLADGLRLEDAPALMRCLPGLSASALLRMMAL